MKKIENIKMNKNVPILIGYKNIDESFNVTIQKKNINKLIYN